MNTDALTVASPTAVSAGSAAACPASSPAGRAWQDTRRWLRARGVGPAELAVLLLVDLFVIALPVIGFVTLWYQDRELLAWGRHLLSADRGLLMTATLPIGGVALLAAAALSAAGRRSGCLAALLVATLAGGAFLTVAGIDFDAKLARRLVPGIAFRPNQRYVARRFGVRLPKDWNARAQAAPSAAPAVASAAPVVREVSAQSGRDLFLRVCASCHGNRGEGIPGSGLALRTSTFVKELDDAKLYDFLKVGRQSWDAASKTKVQMPARGGDPRVNDDDLRDVVAYVREMQQRAAATAPAGTATQPSAGGSAPSGVAMPPEEEPIPPVVQRSYIAVAPEGPHGLSAEFFAQRTRPRWLIPASAVNYFNLFFAATLIGVLHVLAALLGAACILVTRLFRGASAGLSPALVLTTAGWWWATGYWSVLYALLYK